jgi:uncharacterized protein (DUF2141 family)
LSIFLAIALAEAAGSLTINIGNVRNNRGQVVVDICPQARFLGDGCPYHGQAPARAGSTTVTVPQVPAGDYAVQAFHDENGNGEVDRGLFGIPKEGVGFSRNARIGLGPPKWRDAVFAHRAQAEVIGFDLRYFTGASGPSRRNGK